MATTIANTAADTNAELAWQENSSLLYGFLNVTTLEWPSLSVQWLKQCIDQDGPRATFLLGTHAGTALENYVAIFDVLVNEKGNMISMEDRFYAKRKERWGFQYGTDESEYYRLRQRISVPFGEIHKARASDVSDLAAFITSSGHLGLFKLADPDSPPIQKTSAVQNEEGASNLVADLCGHGVAGWGLAWSHYEGTQLMSSSDDTKICVWDVNKQASGNRPMKTRGPIPQIAPVTTYSTGHTAAPQSVCADYNNPAMFLSCGDDGKVLLWDTRISDANHAFLSVCKDIESQQHYFNDLSQNKFRPWLLASAESGHDISLWDTRKCGCPVGRLSGHTGSVNCIQFNPHAQDLLASGGTDKRVIIWDLKAIGREQSYEMAQSGPAELLFAHGGHQADVQALDWARSDNRANMITSVDYGNRWHICKMDETVFEDDDSDQSDLEGVDDDNFVVE